MKTVIQDVETRVNKAGLTVRDIKEMAFDRVKWRQIAKQTCISQDKTTETDRTRSDRTSQDPRSSVQFMSLSLLACAPTFLGRTRLTSLFVLYGPLSVPLLSLWEFLKLGALFFMTYFLHGSFFYVLLRQL